MAAISSLEELKYISFISKSIKDTPLLYNACMKTVYHKS